MHHNSHWNAFSLQTLRYFGTNKIMRTLIPFSPLLQMDDQRLIDQWVHRSQPRPTQISSEKYGVEHGKTKKRDRDDGFAAIGDRMLEDPCSITKCITTIEKLQGLDVCDILVATDIFRSKENREVFLSFSRDDLRLAWIKREIVRSQPYNRN